MENPQVTVFVKEYMSQRVTVEGAVREPGIYSLTGRTSLLQIIAMSKGLDELANPGGIVIYRNMDGRRYAAAFRHPRNSCGAPRRSRGARQRHRGGGLLRRAVEHEGLPLHGAGPRRVPGRCDDGCRTHRTPRRRQRSPALQGAAPPCPRGIRAPANSACRCPRMRATTRSRNSTCATPGTSCSSAAGRCSGAPRWSRRSRSSGALLQTPLYRSTATLQIESSALRIVNMEGVEAIDASGDFMGTQIELLKSRAVVLRAVRQLGLVSDEAFQNAVSRPGGIAGIVSLFRGKDAKPDAAPRSLGEPRGRGRGSCHGQSPGRGRGLLATRESEFREPRPARRRAGHQWPGPGVHGGQPEPPRGEFASTLAPSSRIGSRSSSSSSRTASARSSSSRRSSGWRAWTRTRRSPAPT